MQNWGFLESWEKENLEGDFAGAAEEYEELYRRPSQPASDVSQSRSGPLDRLRAAYRAGLCFETVGNLNRARFAYQWIERNYSRIRIDLLLEFPADRGLLDSLTMLRERTALRFQMSWRRNSNAAGSQGPFLIGSIPWAPGGRSFETWWLPCKKECRCGVERRSRAVCEPISAAVFFSGPWMPSPWRKRTGPDESCPWLWPSILTMCRR